MPRKRATNRKRQRFEITDEHLRQIEVLADLGATREDVAYAFGVAVKTLMAAVERNQEKVDAVWPRYRGKEKFVFDADRLEHLSELSELFCSKRELCAAFRIGENTLDSAFAESPLAQRIWENGKEARKTKLRRLQFQHAENSVPMSIFLGKNLLDQADQPRESGEDADQIARAIAGRTKDMIEATSVAPPELEGPEEPRADKLGVDGGIS